jgi:hypothetical protein
MSNQFRSYTFNYGNDETTINFTPVKDLFGEVEAPYLIVGKTMGGKTTFCADIIDKYGSSASNIYYISGTEPEIGKDPMKSIPKVFIKEPTYENLKAIWETIKCNNRKTNITTEELKMLLPKIYNDKDMKIINEEYNKFRKELSNDLSEKSKDEIDIVCVELLSKLILSGLNLYGSSGLNDEEMIIVQSLISTPQKTILLIDDVSAQLEKLKQSNDRVEVIGENKKIQQMKIGNAYKALLTDIFTTGRRFNAIICVFVHTWNIIESKDLLTNFIICDKVSAGLISGLRTVGDTSLKDKIKMLSNKIFDNYPYHFIVVKGTKITITKADKCEDTPKFDKLNTHYIDTYEKIKMNVDYNSVTSDDI